jgi:hypothetical protein
VTIGVMIRRRVIDQAPFKAPSKTTENINWLAVFTLGSTIPARKPLIYAKPLLKCLIYPLLGALVLILHNMLEYLILHINSNR